MKKNNEIIKLDVEMLEPFNNDEMMVVRGGACGPCVAIAVEIVIAIVGIITGGGNQNVNCPTQGTCTTNNGCPPPAPKK